MKRLTQVKRRRRSEIASYDMSSVQGFLQIKCREESELTGRRARLNTNTPYTKCRESSEAPLATNNYYANMQKRSLVRNAATQPGATTIYPRAAGDSYIACCLTGICHPGTRIPLCADMERVARSND